MMSTIKQLVVPSFTQTDTGKNVGTNPGNARRDAWYRAMEREQAANWLQHGLINRDYFSHVNSRQPSPLKGEFVHQPMISISMGSVFASKHTLQASCERYSNTAPNTGHSGLIEKGKDESNTAKSWDEAGLFQDMSVQRSNSPSNLFPAAFDKLNNDCADNKEVICGTDQVSTRSATWSEQSLSTVSVLSAPVDVLVFASVPTSQIAVSQKTANFDANAFQTELHSQMNAIIPNDMSVYLTMQDKRPTAINSLKLDASVNEPAFIGQTEIAAQTQDDLLLPEMQSVISLGKQSEHQTLRFHTELTETGVRIWLGVDSQSQLNLISLAETLKTCLMQQGLALLTLVCNGRILYKTAGNPDNFGQTYMTNSELHAFRNEVLEKVIPKNMLDVASSENSSNNHKAEILWQSVQ